MTACLWQAHYQKSNMQIIEAITQSAHLYQTPDNQMGFGIPNYSLANALLLDVEAIDEVTLDIYPNPVSSNARAYLYTANHTDISYRLVDVGGREILQGKNDCFYALISIEIPALPSGMYFLEVIIGDKVLVERINVVD